MRKQNFETATSDGAANDLKTYVVVCYITS